MREKCYKRPKKKEKHVKKKKKKRKKGKNKRKNIYCVTYQTLKESPLGEEEGAQCIKEERELYINGIEMQHGSRGRKMNQLCHVIWQRHQRRERGHPLTPHSLTLSYFPLLSSSPFLLFPIRSFFFLSFHDLLLCSFLSHRWAPWSPMRFMWIKLLFFICYCILFWGFHTFRNHLYFFRYCFVCVTIVIVSLPSL